jgi:hypothetical protein
MTAQITNALIRCRRSDQAAKSAFEFVRGDLDLWVRELPDTIDELVGDLSGIRLLLKTLRTGSSDYTLHLAATIDEMNSLVLPPLLTEMAGDCGFAIELIATPS